MRVKELVEQLLRLDPEALVYRNDNEGRLVKVEELDTDNSDYVALY